MQGCDPRSGDLISTGAFVAWLLKRKQVARCDEHGAGKPVAFCSEVC